MRELAYTTFGKNALVISHVAALFVATMPALAAKKITTFFMNVSRWPRCQA